VEQIFFELNKVGLFQWAKIESRLIELVDRCLKKIFFSRDEVLTNEIMKGKHNVKM
jgi:hypothetical protein